MASPDNPTVKKLLKTFMQIKKNNWHEKGISGYRPSEIRVLLAVKRGTASEKRDMKISEISRLLLVTSPTVTQIINDLEKDGMVIRQIDPADRRAVKIKLTEQGKELAIKAEKGFYKALSGLIDHLGEEESEHLAELLSKVSDYFNDLHR